MSSRPSGDDALARDPFRWEATRAGVVRIFRGGREVVAVGGDRGARLLSRLAAATEAEQQQLLARATGNYRRGNERR